MNLAEFLDTLFPTIHQIARLGCKDGITLSVPLSTLTALVAGANTDALRRFEVAQGAEGSLLFHSPCGVVTIRAYMVDASGVPGEIFASREILLAEVARLRTLIKAGEWGALGEMGCSWCARMPRDREHTYDCPAFTSEGLVK